MISRLYTEFGDMLAMEILDYSSIIQVLVFMLLAMVIFESVQKVVGWFDMSFLLLFKNYLSSILCGNKKLTFSFLSWKSNYF